MQLKLYSESSPLNSAFKRTVRQVYVNPTYKNDPVNKITAGSVAALVGTDLNIIDSHTFAPKVDRNFNGAPDKIVGNTSDDQEEFSLCVFPVDNIKYFTTIEAENNCKVSNRAPEKLSSELLRGTAWDGSKNLYIVFWTIITPLFQGKEISYDSVISSEGRDAFREYSPTHGKWAVANKIHCDEQGSIGDLIDKLVLLLLGEKKKTFTPRAKVGKSLPSDRLSPLARPGQWIFRRLQINSAASSPLPLVTLHPWLRRLRRARSSQAPTLSKVTVCLGSTNNLTFVPNFS